MAVLYISEFARVAIQQGSAVQVVDQPPVADQTVAIGAGSAASAAFNANTRYVLLSSDVVCSFLFTNTGQSAAATNMRLPANVPVFFAVPRGSNYTVAVITNA